MNHNLPNQYGVPLHACNGYRQDEHYWKWLEAQRLGLCPRRPPVDLFVNGKLAGTLPFTSGWMPVSWPILPQPSGCGSTEVRL